MAKKRKPIRTWLNDNPDSGAYVLVDEESPYGFGTADKGCTLEIADCTRKIQLDFYPYGKDKKEFEASKRKLEKKIGRLYDALNRVELVLNEAQYVHRPKDYT